MYDIVVCTKLLLAYYQNLIWGTNISTKKFEKLYVYDRTTYKIYKICIAYVTRDIITSTMTPCSLKSLQYFKRYDGT